MENEDIPKEHLRLIYGEIVRGSSYFYSPAFGEVIIKHLTQQDTELLDVKKLKYKTKAEEKGLPTEEERVQDLIKEKTWSKVFNKNKTIILHKFKYIFFVGTIF